MACVRCTRATNSHPRRPAGSAMVRMTAPCNVAAEGVEPLGTHRFGSVEGMCPSKVELVLAVFKIRQYSNSIFASAAVAAPMRSFYSCVLLTALEQCVGSVPNTTSVREVGGM